MSDTTVVSQDQHMVLLGLLIVVITYLVTMYTITLRTRIQIFNKDYMSKFEDIHTREMAGEEGSINELSPL